MDLLHARIMHDKVRHRMIQEAPEYKGKSLILYSKLENQYTKYSFVYVRLCQA